MNTVKPLNFPSDPFLQWSVDNNLDKTNIWITLLYLLILTKTVQSHLKFSLIDFRRVWGTCARRGNQPGGNSDSGAASLKHFSTLLDLKNTDVDKHTSRPKHKHINDTEIVSFMLLTKRTNFQGSLLFPKKEFFIKAQFQVWVFYKYAKLSFL